MTIVMMFVVLSSISVPRGTRLQSGPGRQRIEMESPILGKRPQFSI